MLLSKNILDACAYNDIDEPTSWELCSLRNWLNDDFMYSSFSDKEIQKIVTVSNTNPNNDKYKTEGGNATSDNIFLLSLPEANELLTGEIADGICTEYADEKGAFTYEPYNSNNKHTDYLLTYTIPDPRDDSKSVDVPFGITRESFWLLRTPGVKQNMVSRIFNSTYSEVVSSIGVFIDDSGTLVNNKMGLRPSLWYRP